MLIRPLDFIGTVVLGLAMLVSSQSDFALAANTPDKATTAPNRYEGRFCSGQGDTDFLRLIDESFAFFNPNAVVPNRTTLYQPEWDTLPPENGGGL